jgi:single-stranded-DNA-specific exonuclease
LSERLAIILAARGVAGQVELDRFFGEPRAGLNDPALLPDADPFAARIERARSTGERVMIFGDFDADGLTGLAILAIALRRIGIAAVPYVPDRLEEGHGLSRLAVETARAQGVSVIATVDCGTTSGPEIEMARDAGIDVLVTDHHRVPATLPPAAAVVNPHRPDSRYPDRRLAGSGVAFTVARLILDRVPGGPEAALELADLATVGTVADVAPILGENRAIAKLGLERLRTEPRPGLAALISRSGRQVEPDLEMVAFALAPRLNAAGRMGEALTAARLLLTNDPDEAAVLADELEQQNSSRRDLTRTVVAEARAALGLPDSGVREPEIAAAAVAEWAVGDTGTFWRDPILTGLPAHDDTQLPPAVVVRGPWPVGIIGLVASRLAEELGRTAVVGADLGDVVRASCRSDGALNLAATLDACADLFIRHGGHRAAAGFEIDASRWEEFGARFVRLARDVVPAEERRSLRIDLALPASECDYALVRDLARLAPTGPGNPDPVVAVLGLTVLRVREANGGHTQLVLRREVDVVDGIAFGRPDVAGSVLEGDRVDVVGRLVSRRFGGFESLQLEIRDVATSGRHPEAAAILAGHTRALVAPAAALGSA